MMKCTHVSLFANAIFLMALFSEAHSSGQGTFSSGEIAAFPGLVQTGVTPTLRWKVRVPATVKNFISISTTGSLTASENLIGEVRVLGVGVTSQYPNGGTRYYKSMCQMKFNGATSWTTIFNGLHTDPVVQTQEMVKTFTVDVAQGNKIDFAGRFWGIDAWSPLRTTTSGNFVVALTNGDASPARIPRHGSPLLKDFLRPYVDESNKVKIGPMDVILFIELTHTNPADTGFDGQDLVLLVSFRTP